MGATWLDVMPVVPLARSVPVLDLMGTPGIVLYLRAAGEIEFPGGPRESVGVVFDNEGDTPFEVPLDHLRVDLDDPLGFTHALHWLARRCEAIELGYRGYSRFVEDIGVVTGQPWPSDRLELAKACAKVAP